MHPLDTQDRLRITMYLARPNVQVNNDTGDTFHKNSRVTNLLLWLRASSSERICHEHTGFMIRDVAIISLPNCIRWNGCVPIGQLVGSLRLFERIRRAQFRVYNGHEHHDDYTHTGRGRRGGGGMLCRQSVRPGQGSHHEFESRSCWETKQTRIHNMSSIEECNWFSNHSVCVHLYAVVVVCVCVCENDSESHWFRVLSCKIKP